MLCSKAADSVGSSEKVWLAAVRPGVLLGTWVSTFSAVSGDLGLFHLFSAFSNFVHDFTFLCVCGFLCLESHCIPVDSWELAKLNVYLISLLSKSNMIFIEILLVKDCTKYITYLVSFHSLIRDLGVRDKGGFGVAVFWLRYLFSPHCTIAL